MLKAHYLQKTWCALSLKCDVSLDELERAMQAPEKTEVELQKDVVRRHWWAYTIHDTIWHVRDAWKEVTSPASVGCRKNSVRNSPLTSRASTCPRGFRRSTSSASSWRERSASTSLRQKTIGEELSTEEFDELEKQRRQLEEEVEAQQQPTAPSMMKQLTVKILQRFYRMLNDVMD